MSHSNKSERSRGSMQGLRALAAQFDEMQCYYCRVPTAATIEHVKSFSSGGKTDISNLKVACPYCNTRKGELTAEEFISSKRWRMAPLEQGYKSVRDMAADLYGYTNGSGTIHTASIHSELVIVKDTIFIRIRPGKKYEWKEIKLGKENNPAVIAASYDFLERHYTTTKTVQKNKP